MTEGAKQCGGNKNKTNGTNGKGNAKSDVDDDEPLPETVFRDLSIPKEQQQWWIMDQARIKAIDEKTQRLRRLRLSQGLRSSRDEGMATTGSAIRGPLMMPGQGKQSTA